MSASKRPGFNIFHLTELGMSSSCGFVQHTDTLQQARQMVKKLEAECSEDMASGRQRASCTFSILPVGAHECGLPGHDAACPQCFKSTT